MSHYFPMVSSSPPPFDDSNHSFEDDNEENDDFGDFSSAGNILHDSPICNINYNNFDTPHQLPLKVVDEKADEITVENDLNQKINQEDANELYVSNSRVEFLESVHLEENFISIEVSKVEDVIKDTILNFKDVGNSLDVIEELSCNENNTIATEISDVRNDDHLVVDEEVAGILQSSSNNVDEIIPSFDIKEPTIEINDVAINLNDGGESTLDNLKEYSEDNEIIEDDFADFQKDGEKIDNDFGDFQKDGEKIDNDFDDFQDFESGVNLNEEKETDNFEANFAAFDDVNFTQLQSFQNDLVNESDDEFGHFEYPTPIQIPSFEQLIFTTLCAVFVKCEVNSVDDRKLPSQIIHLDDTLKQKSPKADCDCVWEKVKDIDNTQALTYLWSNSQSNKRLLHSLHLNSQNFLPGAKWASSIPLFAANLGSDPLEPTKAPVKINEDNISNIEIPHQSTTSLDTVVPPVQFDWGSSGLINPLDDSSSALLDLDFFITNDYVISKSSTTKTINSLENEFLGNESCPKNLYSERKLAVSPLVDKILSEATIKSGGKYKQNISKEAKQILSSLQDLSFMQARVLMFPIRDGAGYE